MTDLTSRIAGLSPEKRALLQKRLGHGDLTPGAPGADGAAAIAVIGMGCRFPGPADSPENFWRMMVDGVDGVRETPPERWQASVVEQWCAGHPEARGLRWGGFLERIDGFDPQFFNLSPREVERMDPQQRLLLEVAWEALEHAGQPAERLAGSRTGVFIGIHSQSSDYYWLQLTGPAGLDTHTSTGAAHSIMANRLSYQLDLRGPSMALDTACSSSLVAIHLACQSLLTGESEMALAGGVNLLLAPEVGIAFSLLQFLAPDGRCKTFDASADGFVRGEGCGVVVLKRLADAQRDRDPVLAVIRGTAVGQDGRSNGLTAPNGLAQQEVVRQACRRAGIEPASLGLIETHGTGTALGDPIEVEALAAVLGPGRPADRPCRLGALKSTLGHLEAAAGVAGLIKAVLCLRRRCIPPNLHLRELNPHLRPWAGIFRFPVAAEAWEKNEETPRRAGVSSFGFGGTNAHVVLEEAPEETGALEDKAKPETGREELLLLTARSREALGALAAAYEKGLASPELAECSLRDIAFTAALRRSRHEHRLAVSGRNREAWRAGLGEYARGERGRAAWGEALEGGGAVFIFGGEGALGLGRALELLESEPVFQRVLEECDRLLQPLAGKSLLESLPRETLPCGLAEPAALGMQVALAALWRSWGVWPETLLGHGLGEVAAACAAGALSLKEALRVACHWGRAAERTAALRDLSPARLATPLVSAATGDFLSDEGLATDGWKHLGQAAEDMTRPVRRLIETGHRFFLELASAPMLTPVIERCLEDAGQAGCVRVALSPVLGGREALVRALGELHVQGMTVDWARFYEGGGRCADLPVYPWQRKRCWLPANGVIRAPAPGAAVAANASADVEGLTYELQWVARDHAQGEGLEARPLTQVASELTCAGAWSGGGEAEFAYDRLGPRLDALALACVRRTMRELGWTPALGEGVEADALATRLGVDATQRRLFARLLAWLARDQSPDEEPEALCRALRSDFPEHTNEIELLGRCGRRLGEVLRGAVPAVQVLFPDGSAEELTRFYHDSPLMRPWNRLTGEAVARALAGSQPGRPRRVLELGAGTGATTAAVLAALPENGIEYWFTDVSQMFLGESRRRFARRTGLRFGVLDVEADPAAQGFEPGSFDLVLAANVLHATADLRHSLERVRELLRPGGRLVLLEVTGHPRWTDLVFGLSAGWWKFRDHELRSESPLLDRARWLEVLTAAGFSHVAALPAGESTPAGRFPQTLLLAETAPAAAGQHPQAGNPQDRGNWLILADDLGFGNQLAGRLRQQGGTVVTARPGERYERVNPKEWQLRADRPEDMTRLLSEARQALGGKLDGVVWLWSLTAGNQDAAEPEGCDQVLRLVQALAPEPAEDATNPRPQNQSPRLWLVTRGAQAANGACPPLALAQAPLWGLGRVLALERPELRCTLVDLDPAHSPEIATEGLVRELLEADGEDQIALRERRLAPRLVRWTGEAGAPPRPLAARRDGSYLITGGLGGLGLKMARWLAGCGAGQLVLVGRHGLPPDDDRALDGKRRAIREIEALGAQVRVLAADVADERRMREIFADFGTALPPLRGVVHAAALIPWGDLAATDRPMLDEAFRAKAGGALLLDRLTRPLELEFFVMFSSGAALWGSKKLAAYAAASQTLDQLAHERRRRGLPALTIDWGWWAGGGTPRAAEEYYEQIGLLPLNDDEALRTLERALAAGLTQAAVARIDWGRFAPVYEARGRRPLLDVLRPQPAAIPPQNQVTAASTTPLALLEPAARRTALEEIVREEVARNLGIADPAALEARRGFFSLGMDSLLALQLHARLERRLGLALPPTLALEQPTLQALTTYLEQTLAPKPVRPAESGYRPAGAASSKPDHPENGNEEPSEEELIARLNEKLARLR